MTFNRIIDGTFISVDGADYKLCIDDEPEATEENCSIFDSDDAYVCSVPVTATEYEIREAIRNMKYAE